MRTPASLRSFPGPFELIHAQAGPGLLRLARLGILALWIVKLLLDPLWRLGELPPEIIHPAGVLAWVGPDHFPFFWSGASLTFLWIVTLMVLVMALTNRAVAPLNTAAAALLTIYSSVIHSFGPIVHSEIVLLLSVYALALFAWADVIERRGHRTATPNASAPLVMIVLLLTLTYSVVGINRLFASFPDVFTGDSMEIWTIDASLRGYYFNTGIGWYLPHWPVVIFLLRVGLSVITLFEIAAPLCLVSFRFRRVFIVVMLSFHVLSLVLMNIFFFEDILLYLLLIDWSKKFPALQARIPG